MTYCTAHNSYQIFLQVAKLYTDISFLVPMCVKKGLRQRASLWQLLFVLEFNQKASYLYSILENALDSNETKT